MEIDTTQFALIIGIIMALIETIKIFVNKWFGFESKLYTQVSNHLQHKLEEMKKCEIENTDKIVKAITEMHLDIIKELNHLK